MENTGNVTILTDTVTGLLLGSLNTFSIVLRLPMTEYYVAFSYSIKITF